MKAVVDPGLCIGCGLCVDICPAVFAMNDDNIAIVKVDIVHASVQEKCKEAAESCPVEAIKITN
ncbi:MAG: ferredoxin [Sedimentisphaerales bacterium]|nr:ferredoxin [Sedimentisphaerales bacterium]